MEELRKHLTAGFFVRLAIIAYGDWHDANVEVPFTDVDYKVFTDAARHVTLGDSPYRRHTYRYPPILAWLLTPNVYLHPTWGKVLFSVVDIMISILIFTLVKMQGFSRATCKMCSLTWIFNPLAIVIATRGNSDSVIAFVVLVSVYFLLKERTVLAGAFLALAIHIRLYPIVFSLPLYLSLKSGDEISRSVDKRGFSHDALRFLKKGWNSLYPNKAQLQLAVSCVFFLALSTCICYALYGQEFLRESILYHLSRKDTRHNFSVYFYLLYLEPQQPSALIFMPQLMLLVLFSFIFGRKSTILFCLFVQTFTIVTYNPVLTSQYFIWYLSLLPVNLPCLNVSLRRGAILCSLWIFCQLTWLIPAYLLEYRGRNTFIYIWFQGIGFFCANLAIMVRLIQSYSPHHAKN